MAIKHFDIEITVRKVHSGEWVWRNNVQLPRANQSGGWRVPAPEIFDHARETRFHRI